MSKKVCVLACIFGLWVTYLALFMPSGQAIIINSCQIITNSGFYELNQSINGSGNCIDIQNSSIIFDCKGFNIKSIDNNAIISQNENNLTILNCNINNSYNGLAIGDSNNIEIRNIIAFNNTNFDISFERVINLTIDNITASFGQSLTDFRSINLEVVNNSIITNIRTFNHSDKGINIFDVNNLTLKNVIVENNGFGVQSTTSRGISMFIDIFSLNKNVIFYNVTSNNNFDDGISVADCFFCNYTNIEVKDNGDFGFRVSFGDSNRFVNFHIQNNSDGFRSDDINNCIFDTFNLTENRDDSMEIDDCDNCFLKNIYGQRNNDRLSITSCQNPTIEDSNFLENLGNFATLYLVSNTNAVVKNINFINDSDGSAILLNGETNASIENIFISNDGTNSRGIYFFNSDGIVKNSVIFSDNTITSPDIGLRCLSGSSCLIKNVSIDSDELGLRTRTNSFMQINDSNIESAIEAGDNSELQMYNVTDDGIYVSDSNSYITKFWNLTIFNPLNSSFRIYDFQNNLIVNITENFTSLFLTQFNNTNNATIQLTPHRIESVLAGFFPSIDSVSMNMNQIITLTLIRIPAVITGNFCYTGSILAEVTGSEDCNASGCVWSNKTIYKNCGYGCFPNVTELGADCANPDYEITIGMIIVIVIAMIFILLVKRR